MLSPETVEAYERDGFVNAGRLLDDHEIEELREEIERQVDTAFHGKQRADLATDIALNLSTTPEDSVYQMTAVWMASEVFGRLVRNRKIAQAGAELARSNSLQLWSDQVMYKPPQRGGAINWHQDAPYFQAIYPADAITAWVSLDDADVESGCMWMVAGSHKWGMVEGHLWLYRDKQIEVSDFANMPPPALLPEVQAVWPGARPCPTRAGDVHFHHSLTWHGSPANRSSRLRRSYAIHYMPGGVVFNGKPDTRVESAGIATAGTPMRQADPNWFPVVYEKS